MRWRTAASLAFACAASGGSAGAPAAAVQTQSVSRASDRRYLVALCRSLMAADSKILCTRRKHTSLVPAAILARPKKPDFSHATTVGIHRPSPLPRGRGGDRCPRRPRGGDQGAHIRLRRAVLHAGGAAHESGRSGARSATEGVLRGRTHRRCAQRPGGGARRVRRDAEEMARAGGDHLLRQRRERRHGRAYLDEARLHEGIQSRRGIERLGQGQSAARPRDRTRDRIRSPPRNEPARDRHLRDRVVSVLSARARLVVEEGPPVSRDRRRGRSEAARGDDCAQRPAHRAAGIHRREARRRL